MPPQVRRDDSQIRNSVPGTFRHLSVPGTFRHLYLYVPDVVDAIEHYISHHNEDPKPFIWTTKASDILAKVMRARKVLDNAASD